MSDLTATQIPKPTDEQAFERCNEVLWRCILKDESVKLYSRRGKEQYGVDLTGIRDDSPEKIVGIQCKLKGEGKKLEKSKVRDEVRKALEFKPLLAEYFIVTTAPDDPNLDSLAHDLSISASKDRGKNLKIRVLGWGSMEREIRRYPAALNAFDPSHTPHGDMILQKLDTISSEIAVLGPIQTTIVANLERFEASQAADITGGEVKLHRALEREIDGYAERLSSDPSAAIKLLKDLNASLDADATGRIRFRVAANIAAGQFELGDDETASDGFIAAYGHAPENPKAVSNKALGFLIKGDWSVLKGFAEDMFAITPDNASLAAYYIQGSITDESIANPLALVPEPVRETPEVAHAMVRWQMDRGTQNSWRDAAITAHAAHPENEALAELNATALLDRVLTPAGFQFGRILTDVEQADVKSAARFMQKRWDQVRNPTIHSRGKPISVPLNLMLAYHIVHQGDNAIKVGVEAMEHFPGNADVAERTAAVLLENGKNDQAMAIVSGLKINAETVMIRFVLAMATNDWEAVSDLTGKHLSIFPEYERGVAQAARVLVEAEAAKSGDRSKIFEAAEGTFADDVRANILLAHAARIHGLVNLSDAFFTAGRAALESGDTSFAARLSIADEAMKRDKLSIAAEVLSGHVALNRDSSELRLLANALAYDFPIRERATRFFEELAPEVRALPALQQIEGIYHLHRGAPAEAVKPFEAAFKGDSQLSSLMCLIKAHLRVGDKDAVATLIQRSDIDALPGSPLDRINFCHILLDFGEGERAIDLGYKALIDGLEQADVVMKYFGLVIMPSSHRPSLVEEIVTSGVWVRLIREHGGDYDALVGEEQDRIWGKKVDPSNEFIAQAMGKKVGDSFKFGTGIGTKEIWTVAEIKPRWLHAFHTMSNTFAQRFPGAQGFAMISMAEGDIQPTLDQIRHHSEAVRERANLYLTSRLPMAIVAGDRAGGAIAFAEYLLSIGEVVHTCIGTADERAEAIAAIKANQKAGAVLDALTAWRAAELDVFEVLKERLGPLSIPATEHNQLKSLIDEYEDVAGSERMTIAYLDGQFIRQIMTKEDSAKNFNILKERLAVVESSCTVEPVELPDRLSELGEIFLTLPSGEAISPAILAGQDRLLLCDDMMMRQAANEAFRTTGVWLQAVLLNALDDKAMALDAYSDAVVLLAARRHDYVSLGAAPLLSVYNRDTSRELDRLKTLCEFVGNKGAELRSHLGLSAAFINEIWFGATLHDLKMQKATGLVLRALLTRHRGQEWAYWAGLLALKLKGPAKQYFFNWCRGHFLSLEPINVVLRKAQEEFVRTQKT